MANHLNDIYLVREKTDISSYVSGDAFWPKTTENVMKAYRASDLKTAKIYVKTAAKRLKKDLVIVPAVEERDEKFNLVSVKLKEGDSTC